jgi:hypothetical protein
MPSADRERMGMDRRLKKLLEEGSRLRREMLEDLCRPREARCLGPCSSPMAAVPCQPPS